jgi:hypothetical protein
VLVLLGAAVTVGAGPAAAVEVSGSAEIATGTTDVGDQRTDVLDQQLSLDLSQILTDYLRVRVGYHHLDISRDTDANGFDRRSRQPRLELLYNRPRLWGSLSFQDQLSDGSAGDFEVRSLLGRLSWQASEKMVLNLQVRDESNTADAAVFGRDTDTLQASVEALRRARFWSIGTSYQRYELQNRETGLDVVQDRYEGRLDASRSFLDGRLNLSFDGRATQVDRTSEVPPGSVLADPVPSLQGLFEVDPSPEEGPLEPAAGLIDGDFDTPAAPGIEIGGAFTFRNLGVDVGFLRPVDHLEITVDAPSDPGLVWRVYHSSDNLLWEEIPGVTAEWDGDLLRYTLRFPRTTDRYFKAVNVTVNGAIDVRVTEIRALLATVAGGPGDAGAGQESTFYQADAAARFRPHDRVSGSVSVGASRDEGVAGTVLRRDFEDVHGSARIDVDLPGNLRFDTGYRYVDYENRVAPILLRTEETTTAQLAWDPLETLDAVLAYTLRDEQDQGELLRSTETLRLRVDTILLPDLHLDSQVEVSQVDEPFAGRRRDVFAWHEMIDASPTRNLRVGGGFSYIRYENEAGGTDFESRDLRLRSTWRVTGYLLVSGDWTVTDTNARQTTRQSYSLAYNPGRRLSVSLNYQELMSDGDGDRTVTSGSAAATYRLNENFSLFGSYTFSGLEELAGTDRDITSVRAGLRLFF